MFIDLISKCKLLFIPEQSASQKILAENIINPNKTKIFYNIIIASRELNISVRTLKYYLTKSNPSVYKKT
jgi:hypothetical protein